MIVMPLLFISTCLALLILGKTWGYGRYIDVVILVMAAVFLIWGFCIGYAMLVPSNSSYNNLCPPDQQVGGYCK